MMEDEILIPADEFCTHYNVEYSFIHLLQDYSLIQIVIREERAFIPQSQLTEIEKILRLHYDLDINIEGIEAITHMLNRIEHLQHEVEVLRNKLRLYEGN